MSKKTANMQGVEYAFSFLSMPEFSPTVLSVDGSSCMNKLYEISIALLIENDILDKTDFNLFLSSPAELAITDARYEPPKPEAKGTSAWRGQWRGILTRLSVEEQIGQYTRIVVILEPSISALSGQVQNRVHVGLDSLSIIRASLKFAELANDKFKFRANKENYPARDFVMQHDEDLLSFIMRTMEREGIGLHFEQTEAGDVAVFTDASDHRLPVLNGDKELELTPAAAWELPVKASLPKIYGLGSESQVPPMSLMLRDYNWEDPNQPLQVRVPVSPCGRGEIHLYGENFSTIQEGQRLARIIKEGLLSSSETVKGMVKIPGIMPGFTLTIKDHPVSALNDRYLVVSSRFSCSRVSGLSSVMGLPIDGASDHHFQSHVVLKRLSAPYRPAKDTIQPRIPGSITAWIDGAASPQYAETDPHGRYKVTFPLDISGRHSGRASAWIRMAQPSIGKGYGQNFQLTAGTEVLLTFVDGNPDRPVISAAVPNAESPGLITRSGLAFNGIGTMGGSALLFHDMENQQKLALTVGSNRAGLTMSAGCPANTVIHSDLVNLMSTSSTSLNASFSNTTAGQECTIKASSNAVKEQLNLIQSAKPSTLHGIGDPAPLNAILNKAANSFDTFGYPAFKSMAAFNAMSALKKDLILRPHQNLVAISADGVESTGSFKSKQGRSAANIALLSALIDSVSKNHLAAQSGPGGASTAHPDSMAESDVHLKYDEFLKTRTDIAALESEVQELNTQFERSRQPILDAMKAEIDTTIALEADPSNRRLFNALSAAKAAIPPLKAAHEADSKAYMSKLAELQAARSLATKLEGEYKTLQTVIGDVSILPQKKTTAGLSNPPDSNLVLAELVSSFLACYGAAPEPKGLVIKNDDSYVNIKALHSAALGGNGPVIVESEEASLTDMLRLGVFDGQIPLSPLTGELTSKDGDPSVESLKTILLHSSLVRALADEVSLRAKAGVLAESEALIQLITGAGADAKESQQLSNLARTEAVSLFEKFMAAPAEDKAPAHLALLNKAKEYHEIDRGQTRDAGIKQGILLKTVESGMPLIAQTSQPDSPIKIVQGAGDLDDAKDASQLSLFENKALAQANAETRLILDGAQGKATLSAAAEAFLSIKLDEIMLRAGPASKLELKNNQASLLAPAGINLKQSETTSVAIDAAGVTIKGSVFKSQTQLIQL